MMATVEIFRIADVQMFHKGGKISVPKLDEEMKVVRRQHVGVQNRLIGLQRFLKITKECRIITLVPIDRLLFVAPASHVVQGIRIVDPQ